MSEISELRDAIKQLHAGFQRTSGALLAAVPLATIMSGLSGTREGLQLDWEFKKLAFEITDALLPAIKSFTSGLHIVNAGIHRFNRPQGDFARGFHRGFFSPLQTLKDAFDVATRNTSGIKGEMMTVEQARKLGALPSPPEKDREHLTPLWQTSFGQVEEVWKTLQAMSTENPADDFQNKSLDILGQILLAIVNLGLILTGNDAMTEQEALAGGT